MSKTSWTMNWLQEVENTAWGILEVAAGDGAAASLALLIQRVSQSVPSNNSYLRLPYATRLFFTRSSLIFEQDSPLIR